MDKNKKEFGQIYNQYIRKIYRFVYIKVNSQEIAEDLTSEAFLHTWEFFNKTNKKEIKHIKGFLYKTARNLVIDFYRTKKQFAEPDKYQNIPDPNQDIEKKEIVNSDIQRTLQAVGKLKDEYQDVLIWYYLDRLSVKEISNILGKSENAVRVTIHRAMENLKKSLSAQ